MHSCTRQCIVGRRRLLYGYTVRVYMRRNTTDDIKECLPVLASGISQSGQPLHSSSVTHLCTPGDQTQCRTVTRENDRFCMQQFRCAESASASPCKEVMQPHHVLFIRLKPRLVQRNKSFGNFRIPLGVFGIPKHSSLFLHTRSHTSHAHVGHRPCSMKHADWNWNPSRSGCATGKPRRPGPASVAACLRCVMHMPPMLCTSSGHKDKQAPLQSTVLMCIPD